MATPALPSAVGPIAASAAVLPIGGAADQSATGRASLDMATGSGTDDSFRPPTFADALKFHMSDARSGESSTSASDGKSSTDRPLDQAPVAPDAAALALLPSDLNVALALLQSTASAAPSPAENSTALPTGARRNAEEQQTIAPAIPGFPADAQAATTEILAAPGKTPRYRDVANTVQTQSSLPSPLPSESTRFPALPAAGAPVKTNTLQPLAAASPEADTSTVSTAIPAPVANTANTLATPAAPGTSAPPVTTTAAVTGARVSDRAPIARPVTASPAPAAAPPLPPLASAPLASAPLASAPLASAPLASAPLASGPVPPLASTTPPPALIPIAPATVPDAAQSANVAKAQPPLVAGAADKASPVRRATAPSSDLAPTSLASTPPVAPLTTLATPVANRPPVDQTQTAPYFSPPVDTAAASADTGRAEFANLLATQAPAMTQRQDGPPPSSTVHTAFGAPGWSEEVGKNVVWLAGQDQQKAELVLTPPNLGRIEISVTISNDQASASFVSANPAVREALEQALPRLREMFANAGISLGQTSIGAESSASGDNERGSSRYAGRRGRSLDVNSILGPSAPSAGRQGVGMVDTFA